MQGTTPIGQAGLTNRFFVRPAFPAWLSESFAGSNGKTKRAENRSGFNSEKEAVDRHSQTAQENKRREEICHQREDEDEKLEPHAVAAREAMNHTPEQ